MTWRVFKEKNRDPNDPCWYWAWCVEEGQGYYLQDLRREPGSTSGRSGLKLKFFQGYNQWEEVSVPWADPDLYMDEGL